MKKSIKKGSGKVLLEKGYSDAEILIDFLEDIETYERKEKMWQALTYLLIIGTLAVIITQCVLWAKGI